MTYNILISDPLHKEGITPLLNHKDIHVDIHTDLTSEQLVAKIGSYDGLLVRSQTQVTKELLEHARNLKIVGRAGVGVDNIDLDAATERGIIVVNAPNANTNSAAEHTMAMIMALSRKIPQAYFALKNHQWDRKNYVGVELKNKTLGIIGLGRIGTEVAYRAKGQRMKVFAYDPFLSPEKAEKMGIAFGTLEEVLKTSDFITVHTPLMKETKHLINEEAFNLMKPGVQIVNCARGGIIDEEALYKAIISKKVAGAALDVFEKEPIHHHVLLELPEVIATPHLGASTVEAQKNVTIDVSEDVVNFFAGDVVRNPVNIPSLPLDTMNKLAHHLTLAEKLGTLLIHLTEEAIEEISVIFAGDLSDMEVSAFTRRTVRTILRRHLGPHVNEVNALYLAKKRGIIIHQGKTSEKNDFTNLLTLHLKTTSGTGCISGTILNGLGARIVEINGYRVDIIPEGHIVFIHHTDQPGVIGRLGSLLAEYNINIATMQVDRSDVGGDAIMVLKIDRKIDIHVVHEIQAMMEINDVKAIDL
ncbi:phosphoglycerate dehydrogenase [Ornithinibacillus salinisoli]|uniref:D-3-phosphoglycerate dehydrogenase n=1 Tax=Ornithinibacillus salinisoli TaxID=1848459 RepID=A0ABW4VW29_9BACI